MPSSVERAIERELAAVLGAASARLLLDAARREQGRDLDTVATIVGEASQALRFNQRVLEAALENMSQGISVVDAELRLVAWNRRYAELFAYPRGLAARRRAGRRAAAAQPGRGRAPASRQSRREVSQTHRAHARRHALRRRARLRRRPMVEIRGNPMPGGGFVATFTDVTAFRRTEAELKGIAETLEQRVDARTAELEGAKGEAERANRAKTRFLAAVSHDLAQPLERRAPVHPRAGAATRAQPQYREAVGNIDGALGSAEGLLAGPARHFPPGCRRHVAERAALLHRRPAAAAWPRSSACSPGRSSCGSTTCRRAPGCAATRNCCAACCRISWPTRSATPSSGRILLGCRRRGDALSIEVWDTGPGIAEADQQLIFEEFRRLDRGGQGLGLGLAIAERISRLLGHPISLRSRPGRGASFGIRVPITAARRQAAPPPARAMPAAAQGCVLVVDNDVEVLRAMQALLSGWQCEVLAARDADEALEQVAARTPDMLLLDFHLDGGRTGLQLREHLGQRMGELPCVIITADHGEDVRQLVLGAGCQLLYKPLKPLALKSVMARFLAARATA